MALEADVRPRFNPSPCDVQTHAIPPLTLGSEEWLPIVSCPADFPLELFETVVEQLIHHPEYNSTLILRSETLSETTYPCDFTSESPSPSSGTIPKLLESHRAVRDVHRKLLPRRPGRDESLEQQCTLYASTTSFAGVPCTLVLSPLLSHGRSLPYYHPTVRHLAFRYISASSSTDSSPTLTGIQTLLRIEALVLPGTRTDPDSRLYRTSLSLLETLHRYGWGALTNYQKRVRHDRLIPREDYQDLYLVMRERHKHLVVQWKEVTDPLKHVFEDIGIATYLMLLWKRSFDRALNDDAYASDGEGDGVPAWRRWPRPPGGFLDLGCGNGLLTHILISEGYVGHGIDLRARSSWDHYPERTRAALHVHVLDPTQYLDNNGNGNSHTIPHLQPGVFLIGNHADELTPWCPLIATIENASGYLSIPCCAWSFDERFARDSTAKFTGSKNSDSGSIAIDDDDHDEFVDGLNLGGEGGQKSQYSMYRIWLASLSRWLGWKVECDMLRIPSTRNWAIIGRERVDEEDREVYTDRALGIIREVVQRGAFKTRIPEGKAGGDHSRSSSVTNVTGPKSVG